jgi:hypothetical protein
MGHASSLAVTKSGASLDPRGKQQRTQGKTEQACSQQEYIYILYTLNGIYLACFFGDFGEGIDWEEALEAKS